jgi:hypothetical protein
LPETSPEPVPVEVVDPAPDPEIIPAPSPEPVDEPEPVVDPTPEPEPEPELPPEEPLAPELPIQEPPALEEEPVVDDAPLESPIVVLSESTDLTALPPDTPVQLGNGVVVTAEVAIAVALLQNPGELLATVFTDPAAAFAALGSVGADLPPEVRETAEEVVISAIIAGGIATQAAAGAAATAAYRRKP